MMVESILRVWCSNVGKVRFEAVGEGYHYTISASKYFIERYNPEKGEVIDSIDNFYLSDRGYRFSIDDYVNNILEDKWLDDELEGFNLLSANDESEQSAINRWIDLKNTLPIASHQLDHFTIDAENLRIMYETGGYIIAENDNGDSFEVEYLDYTRYSLELYDDVNCYTIEDLDTLYIIDEYRFSLDLFESITGLKIVDYGFNGYGFFSDDCDSDQDVQELWKGLLSHKLAGDKDHFNLRRR